MFGLFVAGFSFSLAELCGSHELEIVIQHCIIRARPDKNDEIVQSGICYFIFLII